MHQSSGVRAARAVPQDALDALRCLRLLIDTPIPQLWRRISRTSRACPRMAGLVVAQLAAAVRTACWRQRSRKSPSTNGTLSMPSSVDSVTRPAV